jgi:uncharacterized caspase-like protein
MSKMIDGTLDDMRHALLQFGRDAVSADMAVIYYSGRGMEIGGENWLIPVDAELLSGSDAESEAIPLKSAMLQAAHGSSLGLVIVDACRNNPFAAKMERSARYRSVDRGLVRVEPSDNVLVAYAAREGTVASDGDGKHGGAPSCKGVVKDEGEAVRWFRKAADAGHALGTSDLGLMYFYGIGVAQNDAKHCAGSARGPTLVMRLP